MILNILILKSFIVKGNNKWLTLKICKSFNLLGFIEQSPRVKFRGAKRTGNRCIPEQPTTGLQLPKETRRPWQQQCSLTVKNLPRTNLDLKKQRGCRKGKNPWSKSKLNLNLTFFVQKATIIAFRSEDENITADKYCECCGNTFESEQIPLCNKNEDFGFLGSAFPMYFKFIKYCVVSLTLMFVISGIYQLVTNIQGDSCQ